MSNCKREKSSSITQLVKLVAKEVCKEEIIKSNLEIYNRLNTIEIQLKQLYGVSIKESRSFNNANTSWHPFEQHKLENEISDFIHQTACVHQRSNRAISIRLRELFKTGFEYL